MSMALGLVRKDEAENVLRHRAMSRASLNPTKVEYFTLVK